MSFKSIQSSSRVCACNLPAPGFSLRPIVSSDFIVVVVLVAKLHLTLSQPHRLVALPGSSVCEISQARRLEWVAISSSRESSWPQSTQLRTRFSKDCLIKRWAKDLNRHLTDTDRYRWYLYIFNIREKKKNSLTSTQSSPDQNSIWQSCACVCKGEPMLTKLLWTRSWEVRELLDIRLTGIVSW